MRNLLNWSRATFPLLFGAIMAGALNADEVPENGSRDSGGNAGTYSTEALAALREFSVRGGASEDEIEKLFQDVTRGEDFRRTARDARQNALADDFQHHLKASMQSRIAEHAVYENNMHLDTNSLEQSLAERSAKLQYLNAESHLRMNETQHKTEIEMASRLAKLHHEQMQALTIAAMYFTGGAALPALAESGVSSTTTRTTSAPAAAGKTAQALPAGKALTTSIPKPIADVSGMSSEAKRFEEFLVSQPNQTEATTGLPRSSFRFPPPADLLATKQPFNPNHGLLDSMGLDDAIPLRRTATGLSKIGTKAWSRITTALKKTPRPVQEGATTILKQSPTAVLPMDKVIFSGGTGSTGGPVPPNYVKVSRWMSEAEAKLWKPNQTTTIPAGIGNEAERIYVTLPSAARPGGTGTVRVDFQVPKESLQDAGNADWRQIFQPMQNTPIYNIEIHRP